MMHGNIIQKHFEKEHYKVLFNQKTGFFMRCEDEGFPEPIWSANGPELIDLSITSFCNRVCSFCYRGANNIRYQHLALDDVMSVVEQAQHCGTLQIALGGGNPNEHPDFIKILKIIREHNIVPSYTTNGDGLTNDVQKATVNYCGAMAVSFYPPYDLEYYESLVKTISDYGIKMNIHAILHRNSFSLWTKLLNNPPSFFKKINAIVFLNYKPLGNIGNEMIPSDMTEAELFFRTVNACKELKIGFDSCSISGIAKWMDVPNVLVESCEAARFSCFISEDMKMYPCSFMIEQGGYGDLRKEPLLDIWQRHESFKKWREQENHVRCNDCGHVGICKGGCRLFDEINYCS